MASQTFDKQATVDALRFAVHGIREHASSFERNNVLRDAVLILDDLRAALEGGDEVVFERDDA